MKRFSVLMLAFGLTFILLSFSVTSKILQSSSRSKKAISEMDQQYDLIATYKSNDPFVRKIEVSNRAIKTGMVLLESNEYKLMSNILLLVANGILFLGLTFYFFWKNKEKLT